MESNPYQWTIYKNGRTIILRQGCDRTLLIRELFDCVDWMCDNILKQIWKGNIEDNLYQHGQGTIWIKK